MSIKNPYQDVYESMKFVVNENTSQEDALEMSKHLGFMHNALGIAIKDYISLLGQKFGQKEQKPLSAEGMKNSKNTAQLNGFHEKTDIKQKKRAVQFNKNSPKKNFSADQNSQPNASASVRNGPLQSSGSSSTLSVPKIQEKTLHSVKSNIDQVAKKVDQDYREGDPFIIQRSSNYRLVESKNLLRSGKKFQQTRTKKIEKPEKKVKRNPFIESVQKHRDLYLQQLNQREADFQKEIENYQNQSSRKSLTPQDSLGEQSSVLQKNIDDNKMNVQAYIESQFSYKPEVFYKQRQEEAEKINFSLLSNNSANQQNEELYEKAFEQSDEKIKVSNKPSKNCPQQQPIERASTIPFDRKDNPITDENIFQKKTHQSKDRLEDAFVQRFKEKMVSYQQKREEEKEDQILAKNSSIIQATQNVNQLSEKNCNKNGVIQRDLLKNSSKPPKTIEIIEIDEE